MPRGSQVSVEPRPEGRRTVQTDGTQRAESLHDRNSDSNSRGRERAANKRTELVINDQRCKDSHGNDPGRIKG